MDKQEVKDIAELEIRRYFDHYLNKVYPAMISSHVEKCPHGKKISRFKWTLVGVAISLAIIAPAFGKQLFKLLGSL